MRGLSGQDGVFTPQIVVDGRSGAIGSDAAAVRSLIRSARHVSKPDIEVQKTAGGGYSVTISGKAGDDPAELSLIGLDRSETVAIGRGENGGRSVTYTDVYLGKRAIGQWNGGQAHFAIPVSALRIAGADRYALVLREGRIGPILAAQFVS